jgi:hypothetical protein
VNLLEGPDYVATWAVILILTAVLGFLMWMVNRLRPDEPVKPIEPIAEVKGEGAVE